MKEKKGTSKANEKVKKKDRKNAFYRNVVIPVLQLM